MKTSDLRTKREKILYPMAIIFSAMVWIGLIVTPFLSISSFKPVMPEPCIYLEDDEYYFLAMDKAEEENILSSCLSRKDIPDDIYEKSITALESYMKKTPSSTNVLPILFFYILFVFVFVYVSTALAIAHIRLNGVKISSTQYPSFYKIYEQTAKKLGLKSIPNAYIIHAGGALNAFAIKISHKKIVVFYADLIEALVDGKKLDELQAVAAHELTHVRLKHTHYWFLLAPFQLLPILPAMLSRARELSADRGAFFILKNHKTVSQALLKLITGKFLAPEIKMEEYITQPNTESGFFIWLYKITATHPPIPYRIKALQDLAEQHENK